MGLLTVVWTYYGGADPLRPEGGLADERADAAGSRIPPKKFFRGNEANQSLLHKHLELSLSRRAF